MASRGALLVITALAVGACGSGADRDAAGAERAAAARARTALEHGLLSSVRTAPGTGAVTSVRCVARDRRARRWSCRLAGARPQRVAVTVDAGGLWTASGVRAAPAPQMTSSAAEPGAARGSAVLTGCCVPVP